MAKQREGKEVVVAKEGKSEHALFTRLMPTA